MKREASPKANRLLDAVLLLLALTGSALTLLLLVRRVSNEDLSIAGCGGGSACEEILASRWSEVAGVPVTAFGLLVYAGLMVSLTLRGQRLFVWMLGCIAGGAIWLVVAQALLLGKFCPWCMSAHGVGLLLVLLGICRLAKFHGTSVAVRKVAFSSSVTFFSLGLAQLYGPLPVTHRIEAVAPVTARDSSLALRSRGEGRQVTFADGGLAYNVSTLPHIGSADATRVMVEYFDFQCPACRTMAGYLHALIEKHPREVCVVVLPVPLDGSCNRSLAPLDAGHPGSCEYARLALGLWRSSPAAYQEFHAKSLSGLSLAEANRLAEKMVPVAKLTAAMDDPWVNELIQANIADWVSFSSSSRQLPKLLVSGKRILHGLPSGEADFIRVMEKELGL